MKILFIGDPHIKISNIDISKKMFDLALAVAIDNGCDHICDLGDTFDNYSLIQSQAVRLYLDFVGGVKKTGMELIKLVGNHDYETQDCKNHAFEFLKQVSDVYVVDKDLVIDEVLFLPFYRNSSDFVSKVNGVGGVNGVKYLVCHQGFNGYDYGSGRVATDDTDLPEKKWGFDRVIAGHFHSPSGVYVGTPFSHSFGESNQQKRFAVLDSKTGDFKFIDILSLRRHITINATCSGPEDVFLDEPEINIDCENDNVRVVVNGSKDNQAYVLDKDIRHKYGKNVVVKRLLLSKNNDVGIKETMDSSEMVKSYFSIKNIKNDRVIKKALSYIESL